jgi:RNA polymerase sigma-70 factor (ECF subfamily)
MNNPPAASSTVFGSPQAARETAPAPALSVAGSDFESLVLAQQAFVVRLAQRLLAWETDVSDVVQDVFLAAYGHWPAFRRDAKVTTWLASITLNACRTHRRRRWVRFRWFAAVGSDRDLAPDASGALGRSLERSDAVRTAVKTLPQRYREVIVLRYLEGFAIEEIAAILNRKRATIDAQLSRGRLLLRDALTEWMDD